MDNLTILIIDDDKIDRISYVRFLTDNHVDQTKILEAENAKQGIELWEKNHIDCILLDYSLPGQNGFEVLKIMKQSGKELTPVIMLTGVGNEHVAVAAMKEGVMDYLIKDEITARVLITSITNTINQVKLKKQIEINRKLAEEKQITDEEHRLKNEFLHNISHELRTPINPIIGYLQLLHDESLGKINPEQKDALAITVASANDLLHIIDNTIKIADLTTGKVTLSPQEFIVSESINEVIHRLMPFANEKQIQITSEIDKQVSEIYLDPAQFKEIVYHYLSNAIKFSPTSGSIKIRVKSESENFRLEVEDSGIGINSNNIKKLFNTFHQLDESITREYQGTGLGLSLTKHIAEALGGSVGVTSIPGKGSIFYAILPKTAVCSAVADS